MDLARRLSPVLVALLAFVAALAVFVAPASPAAAHDALADALDYAAVSARILAFAEEARFELVETFAERLAEVLLREFAMTWLRLRVGKPGAVPEARMVGVEIERGSR